MTSAVEFKKVDIIFGEKSAEALALLDAGKTRAEILQETGAVLGAAMAAAGSDAATLASVIDWAFAEGLVVAISPSARA